MSNKLAKVLLICALVVCIPMFIAGTVLAVYFSRNASFNLAMYVNNVGDTNVSMPTITSNAKSFEKVEDSNYSQWTVTNCHVDEITISFEATGYNFLGWFEGTYEDYTRAVGALEAGEIKKISYISDAKNFNVKTADYENVTAAFNVIEYKVAFKVGDSENIVDYTYNKEITETCEDTADEYFVGWALEGDQNKTVFKRATFEERNVTLVPVWESKALHQFTVNYVDEDGEPLESGILVDLELDKFQLADLSKYEQGREGYSLSWVDTEGKIVTAITEDMLTRDEGNNPQPITLKIHKELINRTVNVLEGDGIYVGEKTLKLNVENKDTIFSALFAKENWTHKTYPLSWKFGGVKVGEREFTTSENLVTYINDENLTTVDVKAVFVPSYIRMTVAETDITTGLYNIPVVYGEDGSRVSDFVGDLDSCYYVDINSSLKDMLYTSENDGLSEDKAVGLFRDFNFNITYYDKETEKNEGTMLVPTHFEVMIGENEMTFEDFDITIYDLVERLVDQFGEEVIVNDTISITKLTLSLDHKNKN